MVEVTKKWEIVRIEALKGVFKVKDSDGNIVVCKVSKNKMKFPKGVNPPEYIVNEIEHFLENSGMIICNSVDCPYSVSSDRDGLNERGYVICSHQRGAVYNMSKGLIKCKQCGEGYFIKSLCKLNLK